MAVAWVEAGHAGSGTGATAPVRAVLEAARAFEDRDAIARSAWVLARTSRDAAEGRAAAQEAMTALIDANRFADARDRANDPLCEAIGVATSFRSLIRVRSLIGDGAIESARDEAYALLETLASGTEGFFAAKVELARTYHADDDIETVKRMRENLRAAFPGFRDSRWDDALTALMR
jgi:hypothetical protein